jgi:hypothetical protein
MEQTMETLRYQNMSPRINIISDIYENTTDFVTIVSTEKTRSAFGGVLGGIGSVVRSVINGFLLPIGRVVFKIITPFFTTFLNWVLKILFDIFPALRLGNEFMQLVSVISSLVNSFRIKLVTTVELVIKNLQSGVKLFATSVNNVVKVVVELIRSVLDSFGLLTTTLEARLGGFLNYIMANVTGNLDDLLNSGNITSAGIVDRAMDDIGTYIENIPNRIQTSIRDIVYETKSLLITHRESSITRNNAFLGQMDNEVIQYQRANTSSALEYKTMSLNTIQKASMNSYRTLENAKSRANRATDIQISRVEQDLDMVTGRSYAIVRKSEDMRDAVLASSKADMQQIEGLNLNLRANNIVVNIMFGIATILAVIVIALIYSQKTTYMARIATKVRAL